MIQQQLQKNNSSNSTNNSNNYFSSIFKQELPNKTKLITEINFKNDEDIKQTVSKNFGQEGLNSLFYASEINLCEEIKAKLRFKEEQIQMSAKEKKIIDQESLNLLTQKWEAQFNKLKYRQMQLQDNFPEKFIKACSFKQGFFLIQENHQTNAKISDLAFRMFRSTELQSNKDHANIVNQACKEGKNEYEVQELTKLHMRRSDELSNEQTFKFRQQQEQSKKELQQLVDDLWRKFQEKGFQLQQFSEYDMLDLTQVDDLNTSKQNKNEQKGKKQFWDLCLGSQKKMNFKIKLQCDSSMERQLSNEIYYKKLKFTPNRLHNFIYGVNQKCIINIIHDIKIGTIDGVSHSIKEFERFQADLHFETLAAQVQQAMKKYLISEQKVISGDIFMTQHSNLGKIRFAFSVVKPDTASFEQQQQFVLGDNSFEFLDSILKTANLYQIKLVLIPVHFIFNCLVSQDQDKIALVFKKLCIQIRQTLNAISQDYSIKQFLNQVNILYVADQCQANMFDKFSDILKSVLE